MVGGDYIAHSPPGETRHSPKSDGAHVCTYAYTDAFAYSIILALSTGGLTVCYMYVRSSVSRGPDVPLFSLSFFLSFYSSFSLRLLATLSPSFSPVERPPIASQWRRINCAGVLGAPLLLADGPDMGRSSLFVRTWLPVSSRAYLCALHAGTSSEDAHTHRAARGSRRVFGHRIPARFVRGSRMSGLRGQPDCKIIVQTAFRARGVLMKFISRLSRSW